MIELKKCPICENEEFENLDYIRDFQYWYKKDYREKNEYIGFKICKKCGFLTYDRIDENRLKEMYERGRPFISAANIIFSNQKNRYHDIFLRETGAVRGKILDIGCAQGAFLNFLHKNYSIPINNLYGIDINENILKYAKQRYNINIPDIDDEFDFIAIYHTLEHIQDLNTLFIDIENMSHEKTFLYVSIPVWDDVCESSDGEIVENFEHYYHLNHINIFSTNSFNNLLKKYGWTKVIKENNTLYGKTILLQKEKKEDIVYENHEIIIKKLLNQKKAIELFKDKQFEQAKKEYPLYPDAHIAFSLTQENMKNFNNQIEIYENALKLMPNNQKLKLQLAKVYFQWNENTPDLQFYSNNIKNSEKLLHELLQEKSGLEEIYMMLAHIEGKYKKNIYEASDYLDEVLEINPAKFVEVENFRGWLYKYLL